MSLSGQVQPVHTLDAKNRIVGVNSAWLEFMRTVVPFAVEARDVIGRPLWDFIPGTQVRQLWEVLFERVRAVGAPVFVPMRADTAELRRVLDVELHPLPEGAIKQVFECVWTEARPRVALFDHEHPRNESSVLCCAWCNRVQVRLGAWEEIEDAQLTLRIEAAPALPLIQRGVCSGCKQSLLKTFPARVL
ncbi:MAG: PAS domain-containing protein [Povalibacter sp.]